MKKKTAIWIQGDYKITTYADGTRDAEKIDETKIPRSSYSDHSKK